MVDVKTLANMSEEDLRKVQAVIALFALLGITEKQLSLLPEILANWPIMVNNINAMTVDLANLKQSLSSGKSGHLDTSLDTPDNIRDMVGFGVNRELVNFGDKGGKP